MPVLVDLDWLYKKFKGICWLCHEFVPRDEASRDHIVPKSLGGTGQPDNIALAHKSCNSARGNDHREIHFRHYESLIGKRDVTILAEHGLIIQVWNDPKNGGYNVLVAKKVE